RLSMLHGSHRLWTETLASKSIFSIIVLVIWKHLLESLHALCPLHHHEARKSDFASISILLVQSCGLGDLFFFLLQMRFSDRFLLLLRHLRKSFPARFSFGVNAAQELAGSRVLDDKVCSMRTSLLFAPLFAIVNSLVLSLLASVHV